MQNKVRLKLTPTLRPDNSIHLKMEWIEVDEASNPVGVIAAEEFVISAKRQGCAYVSKAEFSEGQMLPGTFWMDEQGLRHFFAHAQPGHVGAFGAGAALARG